MSVFQHWPNRITAVRFIGAFVLFTVFALFCPTEKGEVPGLFVGALSFWLFLTVALTDFLDGYLARRDNLVTAFGRIADPFVDKVLLLGSMIFLAVMPWSRPWFPAWVVVIILAREFLVTGIRGYVESEGMEFPADRWGKIKMIVQCTAVGNVLWLYAWPWGEAWLGFWKGLAAVFVILTVITTIGSGLNYVLVARKLFAQQEKSREEES